MTSEVMLGWDNFFVAEAGAAAALAGLLFVAVSINLPRILEFPQLPMRAIEALLALLSVLVVATMALVPRQSTTAFGIETAATGFIVWVAQTLALCLSWRDGWRSGRPGKFALRVLVNQIAPLPLMVAGGLLVAGSPQGMYWIVPGVLLSFASGTFSAWVLLVEIQR